MTLRSAAIPAAAVLALSAFLLPTPAARAATYSPQPGTKAATASVAGANYIFSVAQDRNLYYTSATGPGQWQQITPPSGVLFMAITGVATAASPLGGSWGDSRLYLIGQIGSGAPQLYELALSTFTWIPLSVPSLGTFATNPAIDAVYRAANNSIVVVVRTTVDGDPGAGDTSGHVYVCERLTVGGGCNNGWVDKTCASVWCPSITTGGIGIDTETVPLSDTVIYYVSKTNLQLLRAPVHGSTTTNMGSFPGTYAEWRGTRINPGGVSNGDTIIIAANDGVSPGDDIVMLNYASSTGSWWWSKMIPSGASQAWVAPTVNNLHSNFVSPTAGRFGVAGVNTVGTTVYDCIPTAAGSGGTVSCPPCLSGGSTAHGIPPDLKPGRAADIMGSGLLAFITGTWRMFFVTGTMKPATASVVYLYRTDLTAGVWDNWLAPRDAVVQLPNGAGTNEASADEYFGSVAEIDTGTLNLCRSIDDGASWSSCTFPGFTGLGSNDVNAAFTSDGALYVTDQKYNVVGQRNVQIVREISLGNFTAPLIIPGTNTNFLDRPWVASDRLVTAGGTPVNPHTLYMVFDDTSDQGRFVYCRGGAVGLTCDIAASWCSGPGGVGYPLYGLSCSGTPGPNCQVVAGGDGNVWVTILSDPACTGLGYGDHAVALRRINNLATMLSICAAPSFDAPHCVWAHDGYDPAKLIAGTCAGGTCSNGLGSCTTSVDCAPGGLRHWSLRTVASPDARGEVGMVVYSYHDSGLGTPDCPAPGFGSTCRADLDFVRWSNVLGQFCSNGTCSGSGADTRSAARQGYHLNSDYFTSGNADHIYPALAAVDRGQYGALWHDYRMSVMDASYYFGMRTLTYSATASGPTIALEKTTVPLGAASAVSAEVPNGDIDQAASAHLHAHFFSRSAVGGTNGMTAVTWSPMSQVQ